MTEQDDAALVSRFRATRDSAAFDSLYRTYTPSLYATAVRITGDSTAAADAVHDAWIRCIERIPGFEGRSSFRTWAYGGGASAGDDAGRSQEYGEWLRRVASGSRSFSGEELGPPLTQLGAESVVGDAVVGFFIVSAETDSAAQSIARTSPHLKHGGSLVLYRFVN